MYLDVSFGIFHLNVRRRLHRIGTIESEQCELNVR